MIHGMVFGGMTLRKVQEVDYDYNGNLFTLDEQDYSMSTILQTVSAKRTSGGHKIASYLRRNGMDVEMVDFVYAWTFEELKDLWKSRYNSNTLFLGISIVFGFRFRNFWLFIEWVRENYPHVNIIGGSQSLDKVIPFKLDWYIYGYGERAMLELITNLKDDTTSKIKYYTFPGGKKVINAQKDYPAFGPSMRDLSVSYEDRDFIQPQELLDLEFSRGCIFRCAFCTYPILGVRNDHSRDEKNLDTELRENYDRFGTTRYTVTDETTNDYSEKLERYAGVTKKLPFKVNMGGYIRGDLLASRKKDWPLFIDLGYMNMFFGIESMHHPSAKAIHKGMDSGKLQEGLLQFKEYAYKNHGFFNGMISLIAGLPHETFKTQDKTVEWLLRNWSDQISHLYPLHMSKVEVPKEYEYLREPFDASSKIEKDPAAYGYEILTSEDLKKDAMSKSVDDIVNKFEDKIQEYEIDRQGNVSPENKFKVDYHKKGQLKYLQDLLTLKGDQADGSKKFNRDKFKEDLGNNKNDGTKEIVKDYNFYTPFRMELNEMIWKTNTGLTMVDWLNYMTDLHKRYPIKTMPNITAGGVPTWNFAEFLIDPNVPYESMMESRSTRVDTIEGVTFASANNMFAKTGVFKHAFIQEYKRKKINA